MVKAAVGRPFASQSEFTIPYQIPRIGGTILWWIWFGLPFLTMRPIWVKPSGLRPLPIITTADRRLTSNLTDPSELASRAGGDGL